MKVYDVKRHRSYDKLASKRRRIFIFKTIFFSCLVFSVIGLLAYLLFFTSFLVIGETRVAGFNKVSEDEFYGRLNAWLDRKKFGLLETQKNILFFDGDGFRAEIMSAYPELKELVVSKDLNPNKITFQATERETAGVWCFVSGCKYFDDQGVTWGNAAPSSGSLVLNIHDNRPESESINPELLAEISKLYKELNAIGVLIQSFTIPQDFYTDFSAQSAAGYDLIFSFDSDLAGQVEVLDIFLKEKGKDPAFSPDYLDLRINGRVYVK